MNLDYQVVMVQALPGGPTRVLAFEPPNFLADYALVTNVSDLGWALYWVLNSDIQDERGSLIIDQLRETFGPGVREVLDER